MSKPKVKKVRVTNKTDLSGRAFIVFADRLFKNVPTEVIISMWNNLKIIDKWFGAK